MQVRMLRFVKAQHSLYWNQVLQIMERLYGHLQEPEPLPMLRYFIRFILRELQISLREM